MMKVEINDPEISALIQERMSSGQFGSAEALIAHAVFSSEAAWKVAPVPTQTLDEVSTDVRGLTDDLDCSPTPSTDRPVDL